MALGLRLDIRQTQGLVLTPQLQQAIKLLQLSNLELADVVQREMAENPFVTQAEATVPVRPAPEPAAAPLSGDPALRPGPPAADEPREEGSGVAFDHRLSLRRASGSAFDEPDSSIEERFARPVGLREALADQIRSERGSTAVAGVALLLVEEIDDDGYLRDPDELLAARYGVGEAAIAEARRAIQACEPTGVGARDLAECLALQLAERDRLDPAMQALLGNLPLLARADFNALMRLCGVDGEDLQEMIAELKALNPRPGSAFTGEPPSVAIPDVIVRALPGGRWRVELNSATLPRVLVDTGYYAELSSRTLERREREYLMERLQSASWLAKALDQRARTVLRVSKAIFARQIGFLTHGVEHLRPLVLRDIAEATGLHESTVSRATADKFVATPWGTFRFRYFFTTAIAGTSGEESHSAEAIRHQIRRMVERETADAVLSDDQIVAELEKSGVAIARRTVAKYREALGIPSSVERRRAKALGR
ncbi:MAG: RNA polymerase factor sigma-54 [Geminicoccaceae bacterium]